MGGWQKREFPTIAGPLHNLILLQHRFFSNPSGGDISVTKLPKRAAIGPHVWQFRDRNRGREEHLRNTLRWREGRPTYVRAEG